MASRRLSIDKILECPICLENYTSPRVLPCQHSLCEECLKNLVDREQIRCPECRTNYNVPGGDIKLFPVNVTLNRLLSAAENLYRAAESPAPRSIDKLRQNLQQELRTHIRNRRSYDETLRGAPGIHAIEDILESEEEQIRQAIEISLKEHEERRRQVRRAPQQPHDSRQINGQNRSEVRVEPSAPIITEQSEEHEIRQRVERGYIENRNNRSEEHTHTSPSLQIESNDESSGGLSCVVSLRVPIKGTWKVLQSIARNQPIQKVCLLVDVLFIMLTLGRGIAGFVKRSSDCYAEGRIAIYLIVKGCLGLLFWGTYFVLFIMKQVKQAVLNPCVRTYLGIESLFAFVWLIVGTVWIFGFRQDVKLECMEVDTNWKSSFLDFASFLVVVDWFGTLLFFMFAFYIACGQKHRESSELSSRQTVQATFRAVFKDEVSVVKGEIVTLTREHRDGYITVRKESGETGKIPATIVSDYTQY